MRKCIIKAIRRTTYPDLSAEYELPQKSPCEIEIGQEFICTDFEIKPKGLCPSAWQTMQPFIMALLSGGENIYPNWMKNPKSAMLSCNDGFRPVTFLVECIDE